MRYAKLGLLVPLALLIQTACVPVEDFGDYWLKAGKDPRLAGRWKLVEGPQNGNIGAIVRCADFGDAYIFPAPDSKDTPLANGQEVPIKTLTVGRYDLLLYNTGPNEAGGRAGMIMRYRIDGDTLTISEGGEWVDFVQSKFPRAVNMKKNQGEGSYMEIIKFDDEVVKIISAIPDTEEYWTVFEKFVRVH